MEKVSGEQLCQYWHSDMMEATLPDRRIALPLRRRWWRLKTWLWHFSILGIGIFASREATNTTSTSASRNRQEEPLSSDAGNAETKGLRPGDMVEVLSAQEIFSTLDGQDKNRGLRFTREMQKFCGKRFRVYKKLDKIILEATGELRTI
jgi:hypothetical protein